MCGSPCLPPILGTGLSSENHTSFSSTDRDLKTSPAFGPVANTDTKLLIYRLFQEGRVLALELVVVVVTSVVRQLFEEIHALKQLRSVLACDLNRIIN